MTIRDPLMDSALVPITEEQAEWAQAWVRRVAVKVGARATETADVAAMLREER